ncbi:19410_t:CDS:2 [Entrophospora sp. SA101]|nr:19410_t:CDS:2 [Entrophospora sp. SA101]
MNGLDPESLPNCHYYEKENIPETQQDEYPDHRNGGKGTEKDDLDNNSKSGSDDNSNNIPNQRGENNNELPPDIQEIANLSLPQAKQKAEQEIEKLLKDNAISGQQLDTKNFGETEFTYQMQQLILKQALSKKTSATGQEKPKKNGLVKPIVILVLSLLALSTLIIIVRKRRQKRF